MDVKLVGHAIQCHGVDLVRNLSKEQQEQPSATLLSYLDRPLPFEPEIKDEQFQRNLCAFIGRKSDLLFKPLSQEEKDNRQKEESIDDSYAIMPAMETFLNIPSHHRRDHFYQSLRNDDCVTGAVISIQDNGLRIQLLCVDKGKARDIEDLDIVAFCPAKELPKLYAKESALDAFQEKDIVRGIVLSVNAEAERIIMSLHEKAIPDKKTYPRIGLITEDEFPVYFRRKSQIQGMCYEEMMQSILGFNNAGNVKALLSQLGIEEKNSHLRYHARLRIPEKEYAAGLKKWQSAKLAHQSVTSGVEVFREGKYLEAMQHFNRALQIDSDNVEALVARGALYANKENYNHAIQDFEEALSVNPQHNNARNYLIETLMAVGRMCEEKREFEEACGYFNQVLKLDPDKIEAKEILTGCQHLMAIQGSQESATKQTKKAKRMDSHTSDTDEERGKNKSTASSPSVLSKTAAKLKQLIREDAEGSGKKKKKTTRSRSSNSSERERKKKKKKRRRSSSSSSSSDSSSDGKRRERRSSKKSNRRISTGSKREKSSSERKDFRARNMSPESARNQSEDNFSRQIQSAAASSFMPVSSFEFFSNSTAIPGLGSPPPADRSFGPAPPPQKDLNPGREREETCTRRDSYLMAEREKFYHDARDRYATLRPRSRSRSSSSASSRSSSSSKYSTSRLKRDRINRSRSKSPVITGVKELDMYLGGAKKLLARTQVGSKYDTWESFVSKSPQGSRGRRSRSRSSSTHRSRGTARGSPESREKRRGKSPRSKSRSRSDYSDRERPGKSSDRSRSSKASSKTFRGRNEDHRSLQERGRDSANMGKSKQELVKKSKNRWDEDETDATGRMKKENKQMQEGEIIKQRDEPERLKDVFVSDRREKQEETPTHKQRICEDNRKMMDSTREKGGVDMPMLGDHGHDLPQKDRSLPRELAKEQGSGIGKFGPKIKPKVEKLDNFSIVTKKEKVGEVNNETDPQTLKNTDSFLEKKGKTQAFMPRVLRRPKMDDPTINRPLLSSNELAALEREKKRQESEKAQQNLSRNEANSARLLAIGDDKVDSKGSSEVCRSRETERNLSLEKHRNDKETGEESRSPESRKNGQEEDKRTFSGPGEFLGEQKKQYSVEDIEQEIERRVQQRLQEEEMRLKKEAEKEVIAQKLQALASEETSKVSSENSTGSEHVSRWDMKERKGKESKTKDETKGIFESLGGDELEGPTVTELNDGWTYDVHGNKYLAIRGTVTEAGWNKDMEGNSYYISEDEGFDSMQLARATKKGLEIKEAEARRRDSSQSQRDHERDNRRNSPQSEGKSSVYHRGRGFRDEYQGRHGRRHRSRHSRSRSQSRSRERKSRERRSRHTHSKSRGDRSKSRERHFPSRRSRSPSDSEATSRDQPQKLESDNVSEMPGSKWDTAGSRWDSKQVSLSMKDEEQPEPRANRIRKESLTELEKFLIDLKQQKKKQWIAEGKVKEKD